MHYNSILMVDSKQSGDAEIMRTFGILIDETKDKQLQYQ